MEGSDFGREVRRLLTIQGMSARELARRVPVDAGQLSRVLNGTRRPTAELARRCDHIFGSGDTLLLCAREMDLARNRSGGAVEKAWGGADGALSVETAVVAAAEDAAEFGTWAEQVSAGAVTIERLRQQARQLSRAALVLPPQVVVIQVAALSREVFALARGHHRPAQSQELYAICAQLCTVMAWLAGDLGQFDAAELQGRTAWACADLAEDPQTSAWVLVVQSKTAFWRGDYRQAVELAVRGARLDPSGTGAVMLACQQADALSLIGAQDQAATALRDAAEAAEQVRGSDQVGGLLSCDGVRHANYAAAVHLRAGNPELALRETDRALTQTTTTGVGPGFGTIAQIHLTRAFAHAQADRIDAVAQAVRPVLDLAPARRLATLRERLRTLAGFLDRPQTRGSTAVGDLHEEITAFCGAPAVRRQLTDIPHTENDG